MVTIGLPNANAMQRALAKISAAQIPHFAWDDPDLEWGLTAITTAPLRGDQRQPLQNYRPYRSPVAQLASAPDSKSGDGSSTLPGRANGESARVAPACPSVEGLPAKKSDSVTFCP